MSPLNDSSLNSDLSNTVHRVNRLISGWPTDDMPPDGMNCVEQLHRKLSSGLHDIKTRSESDAEYDWFPQRILNVS